MSRAKRADNPDLRTTIRIRTNTRDRLNIFKSRKTYNEYLNFLMDIHEMIRREGPRNRIHPDKLLAKSEATRRWMERNVKWKNGRMAAVNLDGR